MCPNWVQTIRAHKRPDGRVAPAQTGERLTDRRFGCGERRPPPNPPFPALSFSAQAAADMLDLIVTRFEGDSQILTQIRDGAL
jgi:hypothetical protein